jgi:hypothetical protein
LSTAFIDGKLGIADETEETESCLPSESEVLLVRVRKVGLCFVAKNGLLVARFNNNKAGPNQLVEPIPSNGWRGGFTESLRAS